MEMIPYFLWSHLYGDDTLLFVIASLEMVPGDDPQIPRPFHASSLVLDQYLAHISLYSTQIYLQHFIVSYDIKDGSLFMGRCGQRFWEAHIFCNSQRAGLHSFLAEKFLKSLQGVWNMLISILTMSNQSHLELAKKWRISNIIASFGWFVYVSFWVQL